MNKVIQLQPSSLSDFVSLANYLTESVSLSEFVSKFTEFPTWEEIPDDLKQDFTYEYQELMVGVMSALLSVPKSTGIKRNWGNSKESFCYAINEIKNIALSAIKIQALIKGYQQRKKYYSTVLELKLHKSIKREKNSNELILKNISQSVSIRKLNLEQCFRAADTDSDGKVSHTELKNFLASLQLSIPPSYISKFLLILDEDCSGIITQEEYYKTLSAFQIGKEQHSASGRGFQHETLIKFSDILKKREIEADELFNLCDIDASGTISLKELERY